METTTSGKFSLNAQDFLKGAVLAVLTPVLTIIVNSLQEGTLTFNWGNIGAVALAAFVAYLAKNFFSPAKIIIENPSEESVRSVKAGTAKAVIVSNSR